MPGKEQRKATMLSLRKLDYVDLAIDQCINSIPSGFSHGPRSSTLPLGERFLAAFGLLSTVLLYS